MKCFFCFLIQSFLFTKVLPSVNITGKASLAKFGHFPLFEDDGEPKIRLGTEGSPQREDPQQRLRWQAHLEFTHNHRVGDLTWDLIDPVLPQSERLRSLVFGGIPHSMRPQVDILTRGDMFVDLTRHGSERAFPILNDVNFNAKDYTYRHISNFLFCFLNYLVMDAFVWSPAKEEDLRDFLQRNCQE